MKKLVTLFLLLLIAKFSFAQQETLAVDTSFGENGFFIPQLPELNITNSYRTSIDFLENDQILLSYYVEIGGDSDNMRNLIFRCYSDGSLDTTFNAPLGYVIYDEINGVNLMNDPIKSAIRTEGNDLLVCHNYSIFRLNEDGSLDTSFGEGGIKTFTSDPRPMKYIRLDNNGNIYRLKSLPDSETTYTVEKLLPDGNVDTSYGVDGSISSGFSLYASFDDTSRQGHYLEWGEDGRFYLIYYKEVYGAGTLLIGILRAWYYSAEGFYMSYLEIAPSYVGGKAAYHDALVHNGKLIVNYRFMIGTSFDGHRSKRFNPDFSLDETYELNETNSTLPYSHVMINAENNKVWFFASDYSYNTNWISRINENGTFDTSFSGNGTFTLTNLGFYEYLSILDYTNNSFYFMRLTGNREIFKLDIVENLSTQEIHNKNIKIYPSPATDKLYFENLENPSTVKILNTEGKFIMEKTIQPNGFIDISALPKGVYVVILDGSSYKFIKN